MKNISYPETVNVDFDYKALQASNAKCCYTCKHSGILPSDYYMREYTITIHLTTSEPDYTGVWGEQNLINDLVERLGCEESDIEIEINSEL